MVVLNQKEAEAVIIAFMKLGAWTATHSIEHTLPNEEVWDNWREVFRSLAEAYGDGRSTLEEIMDVNNPFHNYFLQAFDILHQDMKMQHITGLNSWDIPQE